MQEVSGSSPLSPTPAQTHNSNPKPVRVRPARGILRGKIHRMVAVWPAATQASSSLPDEQRLCDGQEVTSWADARLCRPRAAGPDPSAAHPAPVHRPGQRRSDHRCIRCRDRGPGAAPPGSQPSAPRNAVTRRWVRMPGSSPKPKRFTNLAGSSERCAGSASPAPISSAAQKTSTVPPKQLITKAAAEHRARPSDPSTDVTRAQAGRAADRQGRGAAQAQEAEAEP